MSDTLTKAHVVDAVAVANGITRKKSVETVETLLDPTKQALKSGDDISISGLGKIGVIKGGNHGIGHL